MKAQKITPTESDKWTPQPTPVVDGPHRQLWKAECPNLYIQGNPGRSCFSHPSSGVDGDGSDKDIDANGYYQNAIHALES